MLRQSMDMQNRTPQLTYVAYRSCFPATFRLAALGTEAMETSPQSPLKRIA